MCWWKWLFPLRLSPQHTMTFAARNPFESPVATCGRCSWGGIAGIQILIPSVIRFAKLPTPSRQTGIICLVAAFRKEEEPGRCVAFLHAGMWVGSGPGLGGVEGSQWSFAADVSINPCPAGEGLISTQIHAPKGRFAFIFSLGSFVQDVEHPWKSLPHPIRNAVLICDIVNPKFT